MGSISRPVAQALQFAHVSNSDTLVQFTFDQAKAHIARLGTKYAEELLSRIERAGKEFAETQSQAVGDLQGAAGLKWKETADELTQKYSAALRQAQKALASEYAKVVEALKQAETLAKQKNVLLGDVASQLGLDLAMAKSIASGHFIETARGYSERIRSTAKVIEDVQDIELDDQVFKRLVGDLGLTEKFVTEAKSNFQSALASACEGVPEHLRDDAKKYIGDLFNGEPIESLKDDAVSAVSAGVIALIRSSSLKDAADELLPNAAVSVDLLNSFSELKYVADKPHTDFNSTLQTASAAISIARQAAALIGNEQAAEAVEQISQAAAYAQTGYQLYQTALLIGATGGVGAVFAGMSFMSSAGSLASMGGGGDNSNQEVLAAISALRTYMEQQFKEIKQQLAGMKQQLDGIEWAVNQVRADVAHVQWTLDVVHHQLGILSLQSAQEAFAIAENTDQLEFIRYQALLTHPTTPPQLDLSIAKHWLVSRIDDAFDRLRIVKAEATSVNTSGKPSSPTSLLSSYLQAFAGIDEGGASSAFPVDALVTAIVEFEQASTDSNLKSNGVGARFLRPLHKGVLLDAIERYYALLQAEAHWASREMGSHLSLLSPDRQQTPTAAAFSNRKPHEHLSRQSAAVPPAETPQPFLVLQSPYFGLTVDQRRVLMAHVAVFERGLSAAESLVGYLESPPAGTSMLQRLMAEAEVRGKRLVDAWNALEGFAVTRVLAAWAGDDPDSADTGPGAVDALNKLGVEATANRGYAKATYYLVPSSTDRVGAKIPPPSAEYERFCDMYHEEDANGGQPWVAAPFRTLIVDGSMNATTQLNGEMASVRVQLEQTPSPVDRFVLKADFFVDFRGFRIPGSLKQDVDFPYITTQLAAEITNHVNSNRSDPFIAWAYLSHVYLNTGATNEEAKNKAIRPHLPYLILRKATRTWAMEVKQLTGHFLFIATNPASTGPISDRAISLHHLVNSNAAPALLKPMLRVLSGEPKRKLLTVAIEDDTESPRDLRRLQPLRRWSHEQEIKPFFPRSTRARCTHGAGTPWRVPLPLGCN